jgi:glycosyltransferase involved in cell wall biosynthesis
MVVLEAMDKQMAVVDYDCPTGPGGLITDGVDGLLVAPEDVEGFAAGLRQVMGDGSLRARLGAGAAVRANHHDLRDIGKQGTRFAGPPQRVGEASADSTRW